MVQSGVAGWSLVHLVEAKQPRTAPPLAGMSRKDCIDYSRRYVCLAAHNMIRKFQGSPRRRYDPVP
jgi:hypothetical protein